MLLKRVGATEGVISRQASGLTLDFPLGDSTHYLVGTEDGLIHKCSVSYSEQYLETYRYVNLFRACV
jgi:dynein intermediate chain 4, axonemal